MPEWADAHGTVGLKGLFRPYRARGSVWVPLTQGVALGFVISPLWGSKYGQDPDSSGRSYARGENRAE